jgi:hypothetical protein
MNNNIFFVSKLFYMKGLFHITAVQVTEYNDKL